MLSIDPSSRPSYGELTAGRVSGSYELLLPIAEGGTAIVWAARLVGRHGFQKLLAVKTIRRAFSGDPMFEQMLLAEAAIASRATHHNVAQIRDLGETENVLFLAMEWVDGQPLTSVEAQCPRGLPIELAVRIAADAALGLHAVHQIETRSGDRMGLVHCDVSPDNLLLTTDGVVKVVDLGMARASHPGAISACPDGHVGGKPSFMAPEQARGESVDPRTDVFALGIVLYRLITGTHPFQGDTALERLRSMRDQAHPIAPPMEARPDCPEALSASVMRALERDPERRFQDMSEFARALSAAVPAIEQVSCRDELAEFAELAVGDAVAARREAISDAIRAADARREAEERRDEPVSLPSNALTALDEPVSLPSNALTALDEPVSVPSNALTPVDDADEGADDLTVPRLSTFRPVAWSERPAPPAAPPRRGWRGWAIPGALCAVVVLAAGMLLPERNVAPSSAPHVAAQRSYQAQDWAWRAREVRAPAEKAQSHAKPKSSSSAQAEPAPSASAAPAPSASAAGNWRYDPGF